MTASERVFEWLNGRRGPDSADGNGVHEWLTEHESRGESTESTAEQAGSMSTATATAADSIRREDAFAEAINYRRKDVRCLTVKQEDDLVDAMTQLAANGTWGGFVDRHGRQGAGIHGTLRATAGTGRSHRTGGGGGRPAGDPDIAVQNALNRFLPWHRLFLLELEDELRAIHANIALPYWCWSEQQSLPGILSRLPGTITGTSSGSLVVAARAAGTGGVPGLPSTTAVQTVLAETTFLAFTKALETIHNDAHAWVGGTMDIVSISPADPIFWLVHCEVDRIWTRWTNSNVGERARLRKENRPVIVAGANELPGINMARRKNRVPSLIATTRAFNLGYGYDRLEDAVKSTCTRP